MALGGGTDWRHFRDEGTLASKAEPYDTDHPPIIAWSYRDRRPSDALAHVGEAEAARTSQAPRSFG